MLCGGDDANALGGAGASIYHLRHRQPSLRCVLGRLDIGGHEGDVMCMEVFVPSGEGSGLVGLARSFAECDVEFWGSFVTIVSRCLEQVSRWSKAMGLAMAALVVVVGLINGFLSAGSAG